MGRGKAGRFRSPAGRARYDAVYAEGLRALPEPAAVHDVPTAFGTVRVYRFGAGGEPLVRSGRAGTSVAYRTGIPPLARHHRVHTVDLLGEPGRSAQTAPIRDAGDQTHWLDETSPGSGSTGRTCSASRPVDGWRATRPSGGRTGSPR